MRREEQGVDELERINVDELVEDGFLPGEIEIEQGEDEEERINDILKAYNKWKLLFSHLTC